MQTVPSVWLEDSVHCVTWSVLGVKMDSVRKPQERALPVAKTRKSSTQNQREVVRLAQKTALDAQVIHPVLNVLQANMALVVKILVFTARTICVSQTLVTVQLVV